MPNGALLALETSGQSLGVALISDGKLLFEENTVEGMIHGRALAPLMQKAISSAGLKAEQLAGVAVSLGPGSWTGLRIGISAAKTFAWALKIPLICVPSFEALASEATQPSTSVSPQIILTLRDARSEGFFSALFDVTTTEPVRLMDECVLKPASIRDAVRARSTGQVTVCGDEKCLTILAAEIAAAGWQARSDLQHIPGRALAQRAWARWLSQEGVLKSTEEIHKIGPLYLRASDPELKLKAQPQRSI